MGVFWWRPPDVEKQKRKGDVDGLVRALHYEDRLTDRDGRLVDLGIPIRQAAVEALAQMEDPAAREGLRRALDDPEESVRVATIRALLENGGAAGIQPLLWAVTHWTDPADAAVREEALEGLAWLRHPDVPRQAVVELLTRADELEDADADMLRRLADACGPDATDAAINDLIVALRDGIAPDRAAPLLVVLAPESVEPLLELLDEPAAREAAALALGSSHDSRAVAPLCAVLAEVDDVPARRAAAWALGEIRDLGAAEALLVATGDGNYDVRAAASAGFDKLGNAAIAVALSTLVRSAAALNGQGAADEATAHIEAAQPTEPAAAPETERVAAPASPRTLPARARPILRRLLGRYSPR